MPDTAGLLGSRIDGGWRVSDVSELPDGKMRLVRLVLTNPESSRPRRIARIRVPKKILRKEPLLTWLAIQLRADVLSGRKIYDLR